MRTKLRCGWRSKHQEPWFMIWREYIEGTSVVYAEVVWKTPR